MKSGSKGWIRTSVLRELADLWDMTSDHLYRDHQEERDPVKAAQSRVLKELASQLKDVCEIFEFEE